MFENLRVALHRTAIALGWLGLFSGLISYAGWLPGQDVAEELGGLPPGHPDRTGEVRLSREERQDWAQLKRSLICNPPKVRRP
ncbi:DUF6059 family protein [Streptomyces sp. NPDC001139]